MRYQCCSHIETSQLICIANQLTGFYRRPTLAFNELSELISLYSPLRRFLRQYASYWLCKNTCFSGPYFPVFSPYTGLYWPDKVLILCEFRVVLLIKTVIKTVVHRRIQNLVRHQRWSVLRKYLKTFRR